MRCDYCPLCPTAEDDVCPESEGEYGIEHADGMLGCKHPWNWAKKHDEEYTKHLGEITFDIIKLSDDMCRIVARDIRTVIRKLSDGGCICNIEVLLDEMERIENEASAMGYEVVFKTVTTEWNEVN